MSQQGNAVNLLIDNGSGKFFFHTKMNLNFSYSTHDKAGTHSFDYACVL